jgi:hypothetical protein
MCQARYECMCQVHVVKEDTPYALESEQAGQTGRVYSEKGTQDVVTDNSDMIHDLKLDGFLPVSLVRRFFSEHNW